MQRGKCSKMQNARGPREITFAIFFFQTNHLLNVSLKRKTDNISTIIRRMTTADVARTVGLLQQYVSLSCPSAQAPDR